MDFDTGEFDATAFFYVLPEAQNRRVTTPSRESMPRPGMTSH